MAELKIIQETENPLFKRKEIVASLEDDTLPKSIEVGKILSEKFSVPIENVALKKIIGKFGSKTFEVQANVYESSNDLKTTEPKHTRPKEEPKEEAPAAEAAPVETPKEEAPVVEAPKEAPVEENKVETKE